ncbi:MAG: isoleucine--tRNA ligase [Firmicutes bacterium]|nr:isoleucine--tRNA ligase [Bacillota bacterium]
MDYSQTLNLPKTDFPMRANLPQREPEIQGFWDEIDLYGKSLELRRGRPSFILHDGPPYANDEIHMGTSLNKILKDIVVKFATMDGYYAPYVPGWDTHGLPIELRAIKAMKINRKEISPVELRQRCRDYALKYKDVQKKQFRRLGVRGDWEHPYLTLQPEFEAKQIEIFGEMAKRGFIYKGLKPVYWCPSCETALAELEIEYHDHRSASIYVAFPIRDGRGILPEGNTFIVIWTTTPWTIPANLAIALNGEVDYALVATERGNLLLARELMEKALSEMKLTSQGIIKVVRGRDLEGVLARHPFFDRDSPVILGEHVTLDQGTGCVHTAPGHGEEDFLVGQQYGLPVLNPINDQGYFTADGGPFAGMYYEKANQEIIRLLQEKGALLAAGVIDHQYAHCWRCKEPVLFRATTQWFASVEGFREEALQAIGEVEWIPAWGEERIRNMVADRADWCISRQRVWGVPIPAFYCQTCGKEIITEETIAAVRDLFAREGSDAWFTHEAAQILPEGFRCPHCGGETFRKESDIMDVWFDSGSSHAAVLETRPELSWPADLYLEGSDQHRGWFQSSLLTAVASRGRPPYRAVLTHGFVLDGQGRAMHKSAGNAIGPEEITRQYGADILRLWVASSDYRDDIRLAPDILKQLSEVYRKIRNTVRFLLGNLSDFDPSKDRVPYEEMEEIDRWALHNLQKVLDRVTRAYRSYEYHVLFHALHNFCTVDLSAFYLDILKDRLYTFVAVDRRRRSAQTALFEIAGTLVRMITPVLSHTAEEMWQYLPKIPGHPRSVQLTDWPQVKEEYLDEELGSRWGKLLEIRAEVYRVLEKFRAEKVIGSSQEAAVELYAGGELGNLLRRYLKDLPTIFITSRVDLYGPAAARPEGTEAAQGIDGLMVRVYRAPGEKCPRCWNYSVDVGKEERFPDLCPRCAQVMLEYQDSAGETSPEERKAL